jgi:hypothetical protein
MRTGHVRRGLLGAVVALGVVWGSACSRERETSTVSVEDPRQGGDPDPIEFSTSFDEVTCCERFCAALGDAGCSVADCVEEHCPVPEGLEEPEASQCKQARAEVLCCAWRVIGNEGCGMGDVRRALGGGEPVQTPETACVSP